MLRPFFALFALIFFVLGVLYTWAGVPQVYKEIYADAAHPHHYEDPARALEAIEIAAFYFVPRNREVSQIPNWHTLLTNALEDLQKFHAVQFQGRSRVRFFIYPYPVIGRQDGMFYDTENTGRGNPQALRNIAFELHERAFSPEGDLFSPDMFSPAMAEGYRTAQDADGTYPVILILYEGVGSSGSENVALISSTFLADLTYEAFGPTLLTHEFYHTLGIPDGYDLLTATPFTSDIMGLGRLRPIEQAYLSGETRKKLGL